RSSTSSPWVESWRALRSAGSAMGATSTRSDSPMLRMTRAVAPRLAATSGRTSTTRQFIGTPTTPPPTRSRPRRGNFRGHNVRHAFVSHTPASRGGGILRFFKQEVHRPAAPDVGPRPAEVPQQVRVDGARVLQRVPEDGHLLEGALVVNRLGHLGHDTPVPPEPTGVDERRAERVAEDAPEQPR